MFSQLLYNFNNVGTDCQVTNSCKVVVRSKHTLFMSDTISTLKARGLCYALIYLYIHTKDLEDHTKLNKRALKILLFVELRLKFKVFIYTDSLYWLKEDIGKMTSVNEPEETEQEMTDSKPQCNKKRTFVDHLHEVAIAVPRAFFPVVWPFSFLPCLCASWCACVHFFKFYLFISSIYCCCDQFWLLVCILLLQSVELSFLWKLTMLSKSDMILLSLSKWFASYSLFFL